MAERENSLNCLVPARSLIGFSWEGGSCRGTCTEVFFSLPRAGGACRASSTGLAAKYFDLLYLRIVMPEPPKRQRPTHFTK